MVGGSATPLPPSRKRCAHYISSFLSNSGPWVILDGKSTQEYPVNTGLSQGSILGPTHFPLYFKNLPDDVPCNIGISADDTFFCKRDWASILWQDY